MTEHLPVIAPARLEIFPDNLSTVPSRIESWPQHITIEHWLRIRVRTYQHIDELRAQGFDAVCSVEIDGQLIDPEMWDFIAPPPGSLIRIFIGPHKGAFKGVGKLFSGILHVIGKLLVPRTQPGLNNNLKQGDSLNGANLKTNAAKLGDVIPQTAGFFQSAPDYALPPYRWFEGENQYLQVLLCVGWGKYEILRKNVQISGTPISSLGEGAEYKIYGPGEDLSQDPRHIHWHECQAVGSTSTGNAGLELKATYEIKRSPEAESLQFAQQTVNIPNGAGTFPEGWAEGLKLRIEAPQPITFKEGGSDGRIVLEGDFSSLRPVVGVQIELARFNAGIYAIATYTKGHDATPEIPPDPEDPTDTGTPAQPAVPDRITLNAADGSPVTWLETGKFDAAIGPVGLLYTIQTYTAQSISVVQLDDDGDEDQSWPGFIKYSSNDALIRLDGQTLEGNWQGTFKATPDGAKTKRLRVSFEFPEGLSYISNKGKVKDKSVEVEVQYRDAVTQGEWTAFHYSYTANTLNEFGRTETIDLPQEMEVEVRARRIGEESDNTQDKDKVQWYSLHAELASKTSYPGMTMLAVTVKGSENLSQQSENQITVAPTRILPVRRNGEWQPEEPTRDVMPFVYNVLRDVNGLDQINMAEADRIDEILRERGDTFDGRFDEASTVKQAIKDLLAVGYCDYTMDRNQIRIVRNEKRSAWGYLYTPRRMTQRLTSQWTNRRNDDHDSVEITYHSSETWADEPVLCYLEGSPKVRTKKITVKGITDRTRAWRFGMREMRSMIFNNKSYSWATEMDLMNSYYWSHDAVTDDVQGVSQNMLLDDYRVISDTQAAITVNEPVRWTDADINGVTLSKPNGRMSGPWEAKAVDGNPYQLIIDKPDFTPDLSGRLDPPQVVFGPIDRSIIPVTITRLSPSSNNQVSAEAMNYDGRVFLDDDNLPPEDA